MKTRYSHFNIDKLSLTPKYVQISRSIVDAVKTGALKKNHLLPTINELSDKLKISRDTAERGYRQLKKLGIVQSVPGKGYFIANTNAEPLKVIFFFNRMTAYNKMVYEAFSEALAEHVIVEYCTYNNNMTTFQKQLELKKTGYAWYVVVPHFTRSKDAERLLQSIPKSKLVVLDKRIPLIDQQCTALYMNILGMIKR
jgi:DNA-binding transcriptional regulator YhcF (GntR family)